MEKAERKEIWREANWEEMDDDGACTVEGELPLLAQLDVSIKTLIVSPCYCLCVDAISTLLSGSEVFGVIHAFF